MHCSNRGSVRLELARCLPQESCFLPALRLRALSHLAEGEPAEAIALLDDHGWTLLSPSDKLLRARAAAGPIPLQSPVGSQSYKSYTMDRQYPPPLPDADDEDLSENGSTATGKRSRS